MSVMKICELTFCSVNFIINDLYWSNGLMFKTYIIHSKSLLKLAQHGLWMSTRYL